MQSYGGFSLNHNYSMIFFPFCCDNLLCFASNHEKSLGSCRKRNEKLVFMQLQVPVLLVLSWFLLHCWRGFQMVFDIIIELCTTDDTVIHG